MLSTLEIRDILIIDALSLEFQPGLNVLTGETGAGKSILLDSLGFVLGWRGRADLVRQGAAQGEVTAVFELTADHPARSVLEAAGLPCSDELVLRRVNTASGRKTAWVNDRRVSGEVLRDLSACLLELHGQHDDRGLLDARGHRALLDAFAGNGPALTAVRRAWDDWRQARAAQEAAAAALERAQAEEQFLRHAVDELSALDPQPGEEATLDARRRLMQAAEKVLADVCRAAEVLGDEGAEGQLSQAVRWLEGAGAALDGLAETPLSALDRAMTELAEAQAGVAACMSALTFDPLELETTEERLFAIRALARKHSVSAEDLPGLAADLTVRLAAIDGGAETLADLATAEAQARAIYETTARDLSAARATAAKRLDAAVMTELAPLKMERAVFTTGLLPVEPGPYGTEMVAFEVATNPGAPAGALDKIASGGELSRFLLALKVCLTGDDSGRTLIFDEIDRGVGGATADAVGRRLSDLARNTQVLVVTHSPQVAALGDHHWQVSKRVENDMTVSSVVPLPDDARVDEIARMISGDRITDEARGAAQSLLTAR